MYFLSKYKNSENEIESVRSNYNIGNLDLKISNDY